jgi:hypothetical protein
MTAFRIGAFRAVRRPGALRGSAVVAGEDDGEVRWAEANSMLIELNGNRVSLDVVGGGAVYSASDTSCTRECRITLRSFFVEFDQLVLESTDYEDVIIDRIRIGLDTSAPVESSDHGDGYVIPAGTPLQTWAAVRGDATLRAVRIRALLRVAGCGHTERDLGFAVR